jgi:hypothetical protein
MCLSPTLRLVVCRIPPCLVPAHCWRIAGGRGEQQRHCYDRGGLSHAFETTTAVPCSRPLRVSKPSVKVVFLCRAGRWLRLGHRRTVSPRCGHVSFTGRRGKKHQPTWTRGRLNMARIPRPPNEAPREPPPAKPRPRPPMPPPPREQPPAPQSAGVSANPVQTD